MKSILPLFILIFIGCASITPEPDCTGVDSWPASMAYTQLKNSQVLDETIQFEKTKVERILTETLSNKLYRQLHSITFTTADGEQVNALTISDASIEECSMSDVKVYKVTKVH